MFDLTPKQARFVEEYLVDLNATQAAVRAGYSAKGADTAGPRLLENPEIKAAIDAAKIDRSEQTEITSERVLKEIANMAFYDPAQLIGAARELTDASEALEGEGIVSIDGKRYAISGITSAVDILKLPEDVRRAIVGWGYDRNQNFTLKLADKSKALDQLARHLSLYKDTMELRGLEGLSDRLARARLRADQDAYVEPSSAPVPEPRAAAPDQVARVPEPKPETEPERPAISADWEEPRAAPYQPILQYQERQGFADTDYENADDGFLAARRNT